MSAKPEVVTVVAYRALMQSRVSIVGPAERTVAPRRVNRPAAPHAIGACISRDRCHYTNSVQELMRRKVLLANSLSEGEQRYNIGYSLSRCKISDTLRSRSFVVTGDRTVSSVSSKDFAAAF